MHIIPPLLHGSVEADPYQLPLLTSRDWRPPWSHLAVGVAECPKVVDRVFRLLFSNFLYDVVPMVLPLLSGSIEADARRRPIIPRVMMDGRHGRVLGGCRCCTQNSLKFPRSHVGIGHIMPVSIQPRTPYHFRTTCWLSLPQDCKKE